MTFYQRQMHASQFEKRVFAELDCMGFGSAENGTEHTHPAFVTNLHRSTDQTSLSIRFQPDGVACYGDPPRSFYVEAKYASSIEKTAYEQYLNLYRAGNVVVVIFGKLHMRWNFIENIGLVDGRTTVGAFPPHMQFPVHDGWIHPRNSTRENDLRAVYRMIGSGTPYREIDKSSLYAWAYFKPLVVIRLGIQEDLYDLVRGTSWPLS